MSYADLTQEQKWGFEYAAKLKNDATGSTLTGEDIAQQRLEEMGTNLYAELKAAKWRIAQAMFDAATEEQQQQILDQFGVPDIL